MLMTERELIQSDLEYLTRKAEDELRQLSAKRVWLTGGAGFLGYYLCKGIAFWNEKRRPADRIKLLVMDNFRRGSPRWLEEVKSQEIATLRHDVTEPIPDGLPSPDYVIHAASIASPTFYRQFPLETIDANVIGLRRFLDYAAASAWTRRHAVLLHERDLRRPDSRRDTDERDVPRFRFVDGAPRLLRRVQAARRNALRGVRAKRRVCRSRWLVRSTTTARA